MKCHTYGCSNSGDYFYTYEKKIRALCGYCEFELEYKSFMCDWTEFTEEESEMLKVMLE